MSEKTKAADSTTAATTPVDNNTIKTSTNQENLRSSSNNLSSTDTDRNDTDENKFRDIPNDMISIPRWITWKLKTKDDGKTTKIPYSLKNDVLIMCDITDKNSWLEFSDAVIVAEENNCSGIGFVFNADGFVGIDIDHCIDDSGQLTDEANKLINQFKDTYCEYSQSGHGLHIFIRDSDITNGFRLIKHRKGNFEIYETDRYFAVTGNRVAGTGNSIKTYNGAAKQFVNKYIGTDTTNEKKTQNSDMYILSDEQLLYVMKNDSVFQSLFYHGDITGYNSHSEADIALMLKLAWLTNGNAAQMENLFNKSTLANRDKWQRDDYKQRTINAAITAWDGNHFEPQPKIRDKSSKVIPINKNIIKLEDDAIITKIKGSKQKSEFEKIFNGDIEEFDNNDAAIKAMIKILRFWTNGDITQIERIIWKSKLATDEWTTNPDYRQKVIDEGMQGWNGAGFNPNQRMDSLIQKLEEIKAAAPKELNETLIDELLNSRFNDYDTSDIFVKVYGDYVKFNQSIGTWFIWQGNHWKEVPEKSNRLLYSRWKIIARWAIVQAEINYATLENEIEQNKKSWGEEAIENAKKRLKKLGSIIDKANSLAMKTKIENTIQVATGNCSEIYDCDFDANKYQFNLVNKTVDLKNWKMSDNKPDDLITLVANVKFDKEAKCPEWEEFLKSAIPDAGTRLYLQKFCGYSLTGNVEDDIFFFLLGQGGSGKTTFVEAVTAPMGDYAKTFPIEMLTETFKSTNGEEPSPQLYAMRHCRLAFTNETKKNRKFDTMKLKDWTGGGTLTARDLLKSPITFKPKFKILITGNFAPSIEDITDEGVRRRLRIIPFDTKPEKKNTKLKEIFATPTAKSAIFNWCLEGCKMYLEDKANGINPFDIEHSPEEVRKALQQYYDANDNIAPFAADQEGLTFDSNLTIPVKEVWTAYLQWCKENNEKSLKRGEFIEMFVRRFKNNGVSLVDNTKKKKPHMFKGIGVGKSENEIQNPKSDFQDSPPPPTDDDFYNYNDKNQEYEEYEETPKPIKHSPFADD